jgi:hypothetical protein
MFRVHVVTVSLAGSVCYGSPIYGNTCISAVISEAYMEQKLLELRKATSHRLYILYDNNFLKLFNYSHVINIKTKQ